MEVVPVRRILRRYPVGVRSSLQVEVSGDTSVEVSANTDAIMEEITFAAEWMHPEAKAENTERFLAIQATDDKVVVEESSSVSGQLRPGVLKVAVPQRWCNVAVHTWEGSVKVDSVVEANLEVSTDGAPVILGKAKGEKVSVSTNGGSVEAKQVYASLHVHTGGGNADFQQVLSNDAVISAGAGRVRLGSMYGECLAVPSCHSFEATTLSCKTAKICAGSGGVKIGGLDRNAKVVISEPGGAVEMQLLENAGQVSIEALDSPISLYVPPSLNLKVNYIGFGEVDVASFPSTSVTHESSGGLLLHGKERKEEEAGGTLRQSESGSNVLSGSHGQTFFIAAESATTRRRVQDDEGEGRGDGEEKGCVVSVKCLTANLVVRKRSWMEATMARFRPPSGQV
eukprot:TRINITY_DN20033_c0_g1_i1.p1 TRINITY_DN20033_c0_g1~~TRINITY_DN20033_c0_g1_i1.p1  ORF type:complete len:450 (+),score=67.93 TRINITY_DN20033_c0_g1_i1:162-1352(+)